jgi:peptidoglycan/xylan/chitin deacetylase (PgdA/CDA1 family)
MLGTDIKSGLLAIDYQNRGAVEQVARVLDYSIDSYLKSAKPYLSSEQVQKLIGMGFTVGSHSVDHPMYSALSLPEQLSQTLESARFLRERFSLNYGAFAFPHGDANVPPQFFEAVLASGEIEVSFGTGGTIKDANPRHFQRFSMEYDSGSARRVLAWNYARSFYRKSRGKP